MTKIQLVVFLVDASGSVQSVHRQSTQTIIAECVSDLVEVDKGYDSVSFQLVVLQFSDEPNWGSATSKHLDEFSIESLIPRTQSRRSNFGKMLEKLGSWIEEVHRTHENCLAPMLILFSDGWYTDDPTPGYAALNSSEIGKSSLRLAFALGHEPNIDELRHFLREGEPIVPGTTVTVLPFLRASLRKQGIEPESHEF